MSSIEHALSSSLLGGEKYDSADALLNDVLTLLFRVNFHTIDNANQTIDQKVAEVLLNSAQGLLENVRSHFLQNLMEKTLLNLMAAVYYKMKLIKEASQQLHAANAIKLSEKDYSEFDCFLNLQNLYYRYLVSSENKKLIYDELIAITKDRIPYEANGLGFHYFTSIVNCLKKNLEVKDIKTFVANFKLPGDSGNNAHSGLICYIILLIFGSNTTLDEYFIKVGKDVVKSAKFPHAEQQNNVLLEEFFVFLKFYFKYARKLSSDWKSIVIQAMGQTFQSLKVSKAAMLYFGNHGQTKNDSKESLLNFVNYIKYTEVESQLSTNEEESGSRKYPDIVALIDSYSYILNKQKSSANDIDNIFSFETTTKKLLDLLNYFYSDNSIYKIKNNELLDFSNFTIKRSITSNVAARLRHAWLALYEIQKADLDLLLSYNLSSYLANAFCLNADRNHSDTQFKFCYTLAQLRHVDLAIKFLKDTLLEQYPECYKAWHLLALCESAAREDKEVSFKIVCSVLEAMKEAFTENKLSTVDKWQYVHLKLTQLSLIEEMFGTLEALDLIPEVFQLYSTVFPSDNPHTPKSIGPELSQTKEYLLQLVWIFAADMYTRVDKKHLTDAKEAIIEARNVTSSFKNLTCVVANGYYLSRNNEHRRAIKEFESVIQYDPYNTDAILGIGEILFPPEDQEKELVLSKYAPLNDEETNPKKDDSQLNLFVNVKDEAATYARLKYLLEYSISQSIDAYHSPEVWWYLSLIYEKYHDSRYKQSLLNCIRYKEASPIRKFKFCNF